MDYLWNFVVLLFFVGLAFARALVSDAQAAEPKPNIVLVLADDLGVNDLGCYGRKEHRTPNLDRLAADGMRFTCAYTAQPICSPSRAALMTGKCPARLHLTNFLPGRADAPSQRLLQPVIEGQLPLEEVTLPELLKQAGYATGLFGKWHLGGDGFGPREQGFDVSVSPPANPQPLTDAAGGKGEFRITDAAIKFIEEHRDRPFFCYVPHNCPHISLAASRERVAKYGDAFNPTYAAMIETLDESVGRLLTKVEELGLTERTIFIFTSDNGGLHVLESPGTPATVNKPYRAGKGFLYEGGLREPLIVRWPGKVKPASVCDSPVVLTDLMPTLLQAAGVDPATTVGPLDGETLLDLLHGLPAGERTFYWHFPHYTNQGSRPAAAIREGDWKLIVHFDGGVEMFNLADDPNETKNRLEPGDARASQLRQKLEAWQKRVGAQLPQLNPDFDNRLSVQLYGANDASELLAHETAAATEPHWRDWRTAMNAAIKGRKPKITPAKGDVRLHAKDARVHGEKLRYEPPPHKNVLGYWTVVTDWADWEFNVPAAGKYEVEIQQGCGDKSGGAEVAVEVAGQTLKFTVQETGHFQQMILRTLGVVELPAGKATLAIKPQTKPGVAVMDVRRVVLRPVE